VSGGFRVRRAAPDRGGAAFRVVDEAGGESAEANVLLDAAAARGLSRETQRTYAFALAPALAWLRARGLLLAQLTEARLPDFVHFLTVESAPAKRPSPETINLRLAVLRTLVTAVTGRDLPAEGAAARPPRAFRGRVEPGRLFATPPDRLPQGRFRVRVDRRLVRPLAPERAEALFDGFDALRDRALASLMLLSGLRLRETLRLDVSDVDFARAELRVFGKGARERIVPLAPQSVALLRRYLDAERPAASCARLFVVLRGPQRGGAMTPAGLRSLFRAHRRLSGVAEANPHRLRHTFACDMVRAGLPLPALQRLLGHADVETTMRYVGLSADDVHRQYLRAIQSRSHGR
jgi:site-specific recombinase XerD